MTYRGILADNLISFRKYENISQEELAFRTGVNKDTISLIERQLCNVRLDTLEKLVAYIGLTLSEFFTEGFIKRHERDGVFKSEDF